MGAGLRLQGLKVALRVPERGSLKEVFPGALEGLVLRVCAGLLGISDFRLCGSGVFEEGVPCKGWLKTKPLQELEGPFQFGCVGLRGLQAVVRNRTGEGGVFALA